MSFLSLFLVLVITTEDSRPTHADLSARHRPALLILVEMGVAHFGNVHKLVLDVASGSTNMSAHWIPRVRYETSSSAFSLTIALDERRTANHFHEGVNVRQQRSTTADHRF